MLRVRDRNGEDQYCYDGFVGSASMAAISGGKLTNEVPSIRNQLMARRCSSIKGTIAFSGAFYGEAINVRSKDIT